ncbi:unnamed protein product [Diatraea saccharalis]|uniref:Uncharacterized protein n=1 Tax=Diatraea saccharalis TaxID=40085 RepID=A0A9N9RFI6_9NEOP|nr:unnamed protein product [Diatraea saccharalis]
MPPRKNNNKSVNDSWKKRKRTGGIRRKCSREYEKIKNNICAVIEKGLTTNTNRPGSSATNTVEEGSVHDDCASPSGLVIQTNGPGPTLGADNERSLRINLIVIQVLLIWKKTQNLIKNIIIIFNK